MSLESEYLTQLESQISIATEIVAHGKLCLKKIKTPKSRKPHERTINLWEGILDSLQLLRSFIIEIENKKHKSLVGDPCLSGVTTAPSGSLSE